MGIRDRPISARSPWQNAYAERLILIGSICRDCLDHVVVFGEQHLRHLLSCYQRYYNEVRPHLALKKDAPIPREIQRERPRAWLTNPRRTSPPAHPSPGTIAEDLPQREAGIGRLDIALAGTSPSLQEQML